MINDAGTAQVPWTGERNPIPGCSACRTQPSHRLASHKTNTRTPGPAPFRRHNTWAPWVTSGPASCARTHKYKHKHMQKQVRAHTHMRAHKHTRSHRTTFPAVAYIEVFQTLFVRSFLQQGRQPYLVSHFRRQLRRPESQQAPIPPASSLKLTTV
jgi:hypothetical protein